VEGLIPCEFIPQARAIRNPKYRTPTEQMREASSNPATWQEFVRSLPEWEQDLLRESEEVADTDTSLIEEINRRTGRLYLVTDGGAAGIYGSYGWVVATKDKVLWRG
jgi:PHP family Zn ribbon phosphoesterase